MNIVEYIVKIRDLASGPMRQIGNNADGAFTRMSTRLNSVGNSVDQLDGKIAKLTRTRNMSLDIRQIKEANAEIDKLERKRDRLSTTGSGGMGLLTKGMLMGGVLGAAALGGYTLKKGMDREMAGTSFEVMAGKTEGNKLHKNLIGFATDTVYGDEVFGEAKQMLGFGVAAKNVMPIMKMLGDISMADTERMKSLTLGFSEAASMGKLTGRELLIMADAGFNPLNAMSQKTGRSMADLRKDVEKGKISFNDLVSAMQYATGPTGQFYKGMEKMAEKASGKWVAFVGKVETFAGTIGLKLLPALGGFVDVMNWLGDHENLMYGIATGIGAMTAAWALYTAWTARAAIAQGILTVISFWPIAAIGLLVGAVVWLVKSFDGWGKSLNALWQITKSVFNMLGTTFKDSFQEWIYLFDLVFLKAKGVFEYIGALIGNVVKSMKLALSGDFTGAKNVLTAHITTDADKQIDDLKRERAGQRTANMKSITDDLKQIGQQWKNVGWTKNKNAPTLSNATNYLTSKFDPTAQGGAGKGGTPDGLSDRANGITGGGVRNQTINIQKLGTDTITIHTTNLKESAAEIQDVFIQLFNRVINSGNAAVSPQ